MKKMNKLQYLTRSRCIFNQPIRRSSSATNTSQKIEIPKRIPRGPTDILKALESTISRDPTAAHYKYMDDPFLMPRSNLDKRAYALSKESGCKAAHWVMSQHPDLFQHEVCEPRVEAFFPKMTYTEESQVTADDLKHTIENVLVEDSITVYKALKKSGQEIDNNLMVNLLELVCFHNGEEAASEEFIEEQWYLASMGKEKVRKTWKDGEIAEEIFISIENPDAKVYSAIILGMLRFYQVDRAWQLYQEALGKSLVLNVGVYNSIIRVANFLKEDYNLRWTFITDLLNEIKTANIKPNLDTLNSLMEAISEISPSIANKTNALKTLKEFKNLGIEPSLGTWYLLLVTYYKDRNAVSNILYDLMPHVENKEFKMRHVKDTNFFVTAMDICRNRLHDKELAMRIDKLLHHGNNYDLIGGSYKESIYYRHYFILMVESMDFEEFMTKVYDQLVPHVYVPEPAVMGELVNQVEAQAATHYLPRLWSDMIIFNHTDRENILASVLNIIATNKPDEGNQQLIEQFANVAWSVWTKIEEQPENRTKRLSFTGEMLGNIMTAVLWHGDFEKAIQIMTKLDKNAHSVVGVPKVEALSLYIDQCIKEKAPTKAIQCIQYSNDSGFSETEEFALRLQSGLNLDETIREKLVKIVGEQNLLTKT